MFVVLLYKKVLLAASAVCLHSMLSTDNYFRLNPIISENDYFVNARMNLKASRTTAGPKFFMIPHGEVSDAFRNYSLAHMARKAVEVSDDGPDNVFWRLGDDKDAASLVDKTPRVLAEESEQNKAGTPELKRTRWENGFEYCVHRGSARALISYDPKEDRNGLYISFRGTVASGHGDFIDNIRASAVAEKLPGGGLPGYRYEPFTAHLGYVAFYQLLADEVYSLVWRFLAYSRDTVNELPEDEQIFRPRIYLSGHSLGGATAVIAGAHLYYRLLNSSKETISDYAVKPLLKSSKAFGAIGRLTPHDSDFGRNGINVLTLGAPESLCEDAAEIYDRVLGKNTFRIYHPNDPVPTVSNHLAALANPMGEATTGITRGMQSMGFLGGGGTSRPVRVRGGLFKHVGRPLKIECEREEGEVEYGATMFAGGLLPELKDDPVGKLGKHGAKYHHLRNVYKSKVDAQKEALRAAGCGEPEPEC